MSEFLQLVFSGVTVGSIYAFVALGFALVYNASNVVNLTQGEFVMIGGMVTALLVSVGADWYVAALAAILIAVITGLIVYIAAIAPVPNASPITLIIITLGASIFIRGVAMVAFGKQIYSLDPFFGSEPLHLAGATILPQSVGIVVCSIILLAALFFFLERTLLGKAFVATATNSMAAQMFGINPRKIFLLAFGVSAALGAVAGVLMTPITLTSYDVGISMTIKGFAAAMLGGMGSPFGAMAGGLLIGLMESLGAGYISSIYKDAIAFIAILVTLGLRPQGLFGRVMIERV